MWAEEKGRFVPPQTISSIPYSLFFFSFLASKRKKEGKFAPGNFFQEWIPYPYFYHLYQGGKYQIRVWYRRLNSYLTFGPYISEALTNLGRRYTIGKPRVPSIKWPY
jgi:hypothetical protein